MTLAHPVDVIVDTKVISWQFDQRANPVVERYRAVLREISERGLPWMQGRRVEQLAGET